MSQFKLKSTRFIDSLKLTLEHYEHEVTGVQHYHLASDSRENVFLVALKTVPTDSSGVAHILEHTALCGSEKYPVRDPFFMMIRRSLNTFMNAFTSSDWTAYPFASENKRDFNNLLDVYLDAVFFARLDELDFAQEGHRVEFETPDDPSTDLVYKGVVFNEMKGALSSPVSQLWHCLTKYVYPQSTYHFNSGGEPDCIPDLTYDELKSFYKRHYHPSNSVFMTFGDIPAQEHQQKIEQQVLSRFKENVGAVHIPAEKRMASPIRVQESYPIEDEDTHKKTHVVMSWLLGESSDLIGQLEAHLVSNYLLDNSASPLRKALEQTDLGQSPSPLCGLEDSNKEMLFACGLEGTEGKDLDQIEALILDCLKDVVNQPIDDEQVEAVLHQLELSQREVTGDGYPYGLQLIQSVVSVALHSGDVGNNLDLDPVLQQLRENVKDPHYITGLIKALLINNRHRVTLSLVPDSDMAQAKQDLEESKLAAMKAAMSESKKQAVIKLASDLKERQEQEDDLELLPKVGLEDVHQEIKTFEPLKGGADQQLSLYHAATNGIMYAQFVYDIESLTPKQQHLIPIYTAFITELGAAEFDYLDIQQQQSLKTGGIHCFSQFKSPLESTGPLKGKLFFSGKALTKNADQLFELLRLTAFDARFDETERFSELMAQVISRKEQGISGNGHGYAMMDASAGYSPIAALSQAMGGIPAIERIKELGENIEKNPGTLKTLQQDLADLHQSLTANKIPQVVIVNEDPEKLDLSPVTFEGFNAQNISLDITPQTNKETAWITNAQVSYCAQAFATVNGSHKDTNPLVVLGGILRNGILHRLIREQGGAYGGGAIQDSNTGVFKFYSYRDPRLGETFDDFAAAIDWVINDEVADHLLEESILGVIGQLDKPGSPSGEAKQDFQNRLFKRTDEFRQAQRDQIRAVTMEDVKRVAKQYLLGDSKRSVVMGANFKEEAIDAGFEIKEV